MTHVPQPIRKIRVVRASWLAGVGLALAMATLTALALAAGAGADILAWGGQAIVRQFLMVVLMTALFLLPGLAVLQLLWPPTIRLYLAVRLAFGVGLSVALPPVLLLLTSTVGLGWGTVQTWAYLFFSAAIVCWPIRRRLAARVPWRVDTATIILILISIAAVSIRLYTARDLTIGLLGDSYQHTMITQLLLDHGGLFRSWLPYAPLTTFTYHFGFHTNVAFVVWLTGINTATGVVLVGQLLSALAAPLACVLACTILRGRLWVGIWAALLVGFVSMLPAEYVNWGRYTQLAGQIVGVAMLASWAALLDQRATWRLVLLAGITGAAMMLTHYLVSLVIAAFLASFLLAELLARRDWHHAMRALSRFVLASLLALVLALPWLINLGSGYLAANADGFISQSVGAAHIAQYSALPRDIVPLYARGPVLALALVGLCAATWRRDWRITVAGIWSVLAVLIVAPYLVGLPGAGIVDHLTAISHWFLTLTPLVGYVCWLLQRAGAGALRRIGRSVWPIQIFAGLLALLLLAWGARWQMQSIDRSTQLVSAADVDAMAWVRTNTAPDARFLVNSFPAYSGYLVAGTDAGWWLPLLTGRETTLPPLTYGSERGPTPDYAHQVNSISAALRERALTDPRAVKVDLTTADALAVLRDHKISYVYSGAQDFPTGVDRIDTKRLRTSAKFRLVYDRGGVQIFQLVRP